MKDAFAEHKVEDQSVEQMFGLEGNAQTKSSSAPAQEAESHLAGLEDLEEKTEEQPAPSAEPSTISAVPANPNELTEIELKEGSTYLISDFIPPAETAEDSAQKQNLQSEEEEKSDKKEEDVLEEMVPAGVPLDNEQSDIMMSKISLENTIKSKRGATMDIKTAPMVQEPANSDRLDLTDSDLDLNAQHDLQSADYQPSGSKLTKIVLFSAVSVFLLGVIFVMLSFLELVPEKINPLKKNSSKVETMEDIQLNEMLPSDQQPTAVQTEEETMDTDTLLYQVKNYVLPNGQTLEQLINARHPMQQEMIEWSVSNAVEPDNYSVLVKVPPENAQSFKISYRFNYDATTNELEPTISDSKNLLDSI